MKYGIKEYLLALFAIVSGIIVDILFAPKNNYFPSNFGGTWLPQAGIFGFLIILKFLVFDFLFLKPFSKRVNRLNNWKKIYSEAVKDSLLNMFSVIFHSIALTIWTNKYSKRSRSTRMAFDQWPTQMACRCFS